MEDGAEDGTHRMERAHSSMSLRQGAVEDSAEDGTHRMERTHASVSLRQGAVEDGAEQGQVTGECWRAEGLGVLQC